MSTIFGVIDVETPKYELVKDYDTFQVRQYPAAIRAEFQLEPGTTSLTTGDGFRPLANYIFGENVSKEKIAMTGPVVTEPASEKISMTAPVVTEPTFQSVKMSFILPSKYTDLSQLPEPKNEHVKLVQIPPQLWAVKTFKGLLTDSKAEELASELKSSLTENRLQAESQDYAVWRYNPPWCLWFLRTNEVSIRIKRVH